MNEQDRSIPYFNERKIMGSSFVWLLILPVLAVAAANVARLWFGTTSLVDNAHPESLAVYWASQVAEGKPLYTDFRQWPYNITSFGPVFYFALGNMTRWFHLSEPDMFIWGRRLNFASCIAIALLIYWKGKKDSEQRALGLLGSLVFLSSYPLWPVATVCRPDVMAAFFSIAGFLIYSHWSDRRFRMAALPLFLLAFFSKLSYVSAPASIVLYQMMKRNWKESIIFGGLYGISLVSVVTAMDFATHGLSTLNTIVSNIGAPMRIHNVRIVSGGYLQQAPLVAILSFAGLAVITIKRLEGIYFVLSLISALLSSAKSGSGVNYFLEPLMAGCLLVAPAIQAISHSISNESATRVYFRGLLAALFWVLMAPQFNFLSQALRNAGVLTETNVRQLARSASGFVLSENARLCLTSRIPMFSDSFTLSVLETRGLWSSRGLVQRLQKHEVEYVILFSPVEQPSTWQGFHRLPRDVIKTLRSEYRFLKVIDNHYVYVPKS